TRETADCDFDVLTAADRKRTARAYAMAGSILAAALILFVLAPSRCEIAAARLLDPFGDHAWPPDTHMTLAAPEWLARGDSFVLHGELSGVVPDRAEVRLVMEGSPESIHGLPVAADDSRGTFGIRLEPNRVPRTFRYQVRANDSITPWRT